MATMTGSTNNIVIDITANDNASQAINQVSEVLGDFNLKIDNSVRNYQSSKSGLGQLSDQIAIFGATLTTVGTRMGKFNDAIISGIENCGSKIASFCKEAISNYRELSNAQGELFGVIRADSPDNYQSVGQTIIGNARTSTLGGTLWNETDYINTATELYKTGITGVAENAGTMDYLMKFKTANNLSDEEVGQTMAILQQRANINNENIGDVNIAKRYLNQIQKAADASPADVSDIIKGMSYSDPLARSMNMDFSSEMALLAGFSSGGYTGSQGGTMLRRTLQNLPISELKLNSLSKTKSGGLESVGLLDYWSQFVDQYNQYNSTNDANWTKRFGVLENFTNGTPYKETYGTDMTENQRMAFMYQLLGTQGEALPSLLKGMGFDENMIKQFQEAGKGTGIEDKYQERANTLDGAMTKFENTLNALSNSIGESFSPFLIELANQVTGFLNGDGFDISQLRKAFNNSLDGLGEILAQYLGEDTVANLKDLGKKLFELGIDLAQVSWEALPQVIDNISEVVDSLAGGNFIEAFRKSMKIFDNLDFGNISDESAKNLGENISSLLNFFMQVGGYGDIIKNIGVAILGLSAAIKIVDFFSELANLTGVAGGTVAGAGTGAGTGVGTGAGAGALSGIGGVVSGTGLLSAGGVIMGLISGLALLSQAIKTTTDNIYGEGTWDSKDHSGQDNAYWSMDYYDKQQKKMDAQKRDKNDDNSLAKQRQRDSQHTPKTSPISPSNLGALRILSGDNKIPAVPTQQTSTPTTVVAPKSDPVSNTINSNINTQTTMSNNTAVQTAVNVNSPFTLSMHLPITVNGSTSVTKTVSGNRSSTQKVQNAVSNVAKNSSGGHQTIDN